MSGYPPPKTTAEWREALSRYKKTPEMIAYYEGAIPRSERLIATWRFGAEHWEEHWRDWCLNCAENEENRLPVIRETLARWKQEETSNG